MKKTIIALAVGQVFMLPALAYASTPAKNEQPENAVQLAEIIVRGTPFSQQIGTQRISEKQIARMPTTNGNITELLKSNPNVQFSDRSEMSTNGGEIRPDEVSFHGEKFYNNNFMIDGISNNDNINPGDSARAMADRRPAGMEAYDLPAGGTQSFWISTRLLKNVEVFDSNISAKYGNFTGGVVNAELKDPDLDRDFGSVSYRTTSSSWAKFKVQKERLEEFNQALRIDSQPSFRKHQYELMLNQKFADNFGVIFAYNRNSSDIGFVHSIMRPTQGGNDAPHYTYNQQRLAETLLLKGIYFPDNGDVWRATFIYSPHQADMPKTNVLNGGFKNTGGGFSGLLDWEKQFDSLKMKTSLSYKRTGNEIEHEEEVYRIYRHTPSIDWISSNKSANWGGFGQNRTVKESYTLKQGFSLTEFDTGALAHQIIFGWQADLAQAKFERPKNIYNYTYTENSNVVCGNANECINGEQFASLAMLYPARSVKVNDSSYSAYLEDHLTWKNWQLNLGARVDYNQYLKNVNISPRISTSYDVFGDEQTQLFSGFSRYYAGSMLAYKLREGIGETLRFDRAVDGAWKHRSNVLQGNSFSAKDLKTPYSDEYVLGVGQKIKGAELILKWVHRDGKDQFTRQSQGLESRLSNDGWSKNDSITLSFQREKPIKLRYADISWNFGASYSKGKSNNSHYDVSSTEERAEKAIYRNQIVDITDLPQDDFNTRMKLFLNLNTEFPQWRLNWNQRLSYQPSHKFIDAEERTRVDCSTESNRKRCGDFTGEAIPYIDASKGSLFTLDWRFTYTQPTFRDQNLQLTLDINNVLNKTAETRSSGNTIHYKMGRNFWLGASYNW